MSRQFPHTRAAGANRHGILWMVAAMGGFALEDALIKRATLELPILPFGIGLGVAFFGERVDATMGLGAAIILAAGLLIAWHGRRAATHRSRAGIRGC